MNVTLIDRIGAVVLQNGIMRVDCFAAGPNGQETASGRLLIPATQASAARIIASPRPRLRRSGATAR